MRICKHAQYKVIDTILSPKYSTDEILINVNRILPNTEHYIIKFKDCNQYPDWFYMGGAMVRRHKKQRNGQGMVYVVPMSKRETFERIDDRDCGHTI